MTSPLEYLERALEIVEEPTEVIEVIEKYVETVREHRGVERNGVVLENHVVVAEPRSPILVIGDIHGDIDTLEEILRDPQAERALLNGYIVFLGDYVDRGPKQLEAILTPLLMYIENPTHVIVLRGNHEPPPDLPPYPHDFPFHLKIRYPGNPEIGEKLYQSFLYDVFPNLPDAAIIRDTVFFVHGGPPTTFLNARDWREALATDKFPTPPELLEELLWNDPCDCEEDYEPNPRGAGKLWGPRITRRVLELTGVKLIIRGHEAVDEGYKFDHEGKVLTIFSRLGAPYYNRRAAYLVLDLSRENWFERSSLESMIRLVEEAEEGEE